MRRLGAPPEAIKSMLLTLQNARHRVKTAHGVSTEFYDAAELEVFLHGLGQGNGCGPCGWGAVSTPLINMLHEEGFGLKIKNPITGVLILLVCFAFVDDTDLIHSSNELFGDHEVLPTRGNAECFGSLGRRSQSYWRSISTKQILLVFA